MNIDENAIVANAAAKVAEDAALGAWNNIKKFFKDINRHDEIVFGTAYEEYLENTKKRNSKVKTLIYRHVPQDLYSFYECVGVQYNEKVIKTDNIENIISINNKIIITGTGGIGKTTLLKHLFLNTIEETTYIPVLIELRAANAIDNEKLNVKRLIYENLVNNGFKIEEEYFDYSMEQGAYVILFDGFDEVNREKIQKMTTEITALSNKYPQNKYIVTSRPTDDFVGWNDYVEMQSMELSKEQALHLIEKIEFDENVKKIFYKELDETLYDKYQSFASNPLLLTIMLLTFDNRASIPDKLNDFYEQAFATLFNMHDATKEAYVRDIRSGLGCEDFKMIFAYFCFKSYFTGENEFNEISLRKYLQMCQNKFVNIKFDIDDFLMDLTQSVCMLVKEGINYRFTHRSFQEYFAAWYTCKLVDSEQSELLENWIKTSNAIKTDSYFTMLYNLQGEKVNKIILYPGIKKLRKKYLETGFSMPFLKYLFSGVNIERQREDKKWTYRLSLRIKNSYLCNILMQTCKLNNYTYPELNRNREIEVARKLSENSKKKFMYFSAALKIVPESNMLEALEWFKEQVEFALSIAEKIEKNKSKGKTMEDILNKL